MAKSDAAIEREIKSVADIWNANGCTDPQALENKLCSAIFHTLLWARGRREQAPSDVVAKLFRKEK